MRSNLSRTVVFFKPSFSFSPHSPSIDSILFVTTSKFCLNDSFSFWSDLQFSALSKRSCLVWESSLINSILSSSLSKFVIFRVSRSFLRDCTSLSSSSFSSVSFLTMFSFISLFSLFNFSTSSHLSRLMISSHCTFFPSSWTSNSSSLSVVFCSVSSLTRICRFTI